MSDLTFSTHRPAWIGRHFSAMAQAGIRIARLMLARRRERAALATLDERMLRDIGVTPYEAGIEACKPFWSR